MTIGIVGTGRVGGALGARLAASGMDVRFGARPEADVSALLAACDGRAVAVPVAEVAQGADMVFLAVPSGAAVEVAASLPAGTIAVDCVNPVRWDDGPVLEPPPEGSVTAAIAAAYPGLRVVKAFNVFGSEWHADPQSAAGPIEVPMASDDAEAKAAVAELAKRAGFTPIDAGPLRNAALLEAHAALWIHLATAGGRGRDWAFKHVGRSAGT